MDKISRNPEKQVKESQVSEKQGKSTVGEGERRTQSPVKDNRSLAPLETKEILYPILNASDWDTLKQLRLVSQAIYQTSIQILYGLSPLMSKALFIFDISELLEVKLKEIQAPEPGQSTEPQIEYTPIEVNDILKNMGITDFEKTQANFSITIEEAYTIEDVQKLEGFVTLIQSDKLSPEQKAILSKI